MCLALKTTAVLPGSDQACPHRPKEIELPVVGPSSKPSKRRRSLWELSASAACPVLGVCLPMCEQRTLMHKCGIDVQGRSDYELHQIGVSECRRRTPLAERLQKLLDAHFSAELRQVAHCASADELRQRWQQAKGEPVWGGLMWALLTHPACLLTLEHELLGDVHMMQHQVGMVTRVEQRQWQQQRSELAQLRTELAEHKARAQRQLQQGQQRQQQAQAEIQRLRQSLLQAEAERERQVLRCQHLLIEQPQAEALQALRAENADLRLQCQQAKRAARVQARQALTAPVRTESERLEHGPERQCPDPQWSNAAAVPEPDQHLIGSPCGQHGLDARLTGCAAAPTAATKIACVGGRSAQLPAFRAVVQAHGAQLLHHDGGQEHSLSLLPATLAAADWVICQVGCISHNAYWRVKDHCKRTGKPCLYVESASRSALERALLQIKQIKAAQHPAAAPAPAASAYKPLGSGRTRG